MVEGMYKLMAMQLVCLTQGLDLRKIRLRGSESKHLYEVVRSHVAFVDRDRPLDQEIRDLIERLRLQACLVGST